MNGFTEIYSQNDLNTAKLQLRKGLIVFCAVLLLFIVFCAAFVVLFAVCGLNVYLCFSLNFIASVAFLWYAVIYFKCGYGKKRQLLNFYRTFDNADIRPAHGAFAGVSGETEEKSVVFTRLLFKTFDGETELLIKSGVEAPFTEGREYDLLVAGNKISAYKGAENA